MIDRDIAVYIFTCGAALLLMGMGLGLSSLMPGIDRWSKRFFAGFFGVLFLDCCMALAEIVACTLPGARPVIVVTDFLMSVLIVTTLPMLTVFLLHSTGEDWRKSPVFRVVSVLMGLYYAMVVFAQFTTLFYYITPQNQLVLGPLYPVAIAPVVLIELINVASLIRLRSRLTRKRFCAMLVALLPLTAASIAHLFVSVFPLIDIAIAISALSMYGIILTDQVEQYMRQQRRIARQSAEITVLQMRPHFIHNTLTSIYYLCRQDPEEAQRVTLNFNNYLEKNLAALSSDETIPFTEELEHTRAYLNVEQALYDEKLFVDYDTPHTRFRLPPLTLQPIVENAVKHALDPDSDPIRICIRTRDTASGSEIVVSDNGPGYEPVDDGKPHIALSNIRQRLELMCRGKMTIMPREGGGTVVRLLIPDAEKAGN